MRWVGGLETWDSQDAYPWVGDPLMKGNYNCRGCFRGLRGPSPTLGLPAQGFCTRKISPQNIWLWRHAELSFGEPVGNRDYTFKGCSQNLTCSGIQSRSRNLKGSWIRPTFCSWRASQRVRRQPELMLGTQTLVAAIWGSSFYHKNPGTGKCLYGILPITC